MPRRWCSENDAAPWVAAHRGTARAIARRTSANRRPRGRRPQRFVSGLDAGDLERYLLRAAAPACPYQRRSAATIETLSPEKRALLLAAAAQAAGRLIDAHPAGAKLALLSGARRRRQIQPPADGGARRARPRVPGRGAHQRLRRARSTSATWPTLAARGVTPDSADGGVVTFRPERRGRPRRHPYQPARLLCRHRSESFRPDVILASTDDPAQLLLEAALQSGKARVVYLARATLAVPFGPDCAFPSEAKTERLRAVRSRGRSQPVRRRLLPPVRRNRRGACADLADGAGGLAGRSAASTTSSSRW